MPRPNFHKQAIFLKMLIMDFHIGKKMKRKIDVHCDGTLSLPLSSLLVLSVLSIAEQLLNTIIYHKFR